MLPIEWLRGHEVLLWWMGVASIVAFFGSLIAVPALVVRIPVDYFLRRRRSFREVNLYMSGWRIAGMIVKNIIGVVLVLMGIVMFVTPGPGMITILFGLFLMSFPGKRALERGIIKAPAVLKTVNWMRSRRNRPPLEV